MIDVQVINLTVILRGRFEEEPKRKYQKEKSDEENAEKSFEELESEEVLGQKFR